MVYKLAQALGVADERMLDLVALATVADVVPLVDENRASWRAGYGGSPARPSAPGSRRSCGRPGSMPPPSTPVRSAFASLPVSTLRAG